MKFSIDELRDYAHCPMLYKFKYVDQSNKTKLINIYEKYDKDLHIVAYRYFNKVKNDGIYDLKGLKSSWGHLWLDGKVDDDFNYNPQSWRDTHMQRWKKGVDVIIKFHDHFKNIECSPIVIGTQYEYKLTNNITITGTWDLILEIGDSIEIIDFKTDNSKSTPIHIDLDINVTSACYAFRKLTGQNESRVGYYLYEKGKLIYTTRNDNDIELMKRNIINIIRCITNEIYYVCPDSKCCGCAYNDICRKHSKDAIIK